jgi:hypothetical protein
MESFFVSLSSKSSEESLVTSDLGNYVLLGVFRAKRLQAFENLLGIVSRDQCSGATIFQPQGDAALVFDREKSPISLGDATISRPVAAGLKCFIACAISA